MNRTAANRVWEALIASKWTVQFLQEHNNKIRVYQIQGEARTFSQYLAANFIDSQSQNLLEPIWRVNLASLR